MNPTNSSPVEQAAGLDGSPSSVPAEPPVSVIEEWPAWTRRFAPWSGLLLVLLALLLLMPLMRVGLWQPWETQLLEELAAPGATPEPAAATAGNQSPLRRALSWPSHLLFFGEGRIAELLRTSLVPLGGAEFVLRLPAMLLHVLLLVVLLRMAGRRWGRTVALVAGIALISTPHFLLQAGLTLGNGLLTASLGLLLLLLGDPQPGAPGSADRRLIGLAVAAVAVFLSGGLFWLGLPILVALSWWLCAPHHRLRRSAALVLLGCGLIGLGAIGLLPSAWRAGLLPDFTPLLTTAPRSAATFEKAGQHLLFSLFPLSLLLPAGLVVLTRTWLTSPRSRPGTASSVEGTPEQVGSEDGLLLLLLWLGLEFGWTSFGHWLGQPPILGGGQVAIALAVGLLATAARPARRQAALFLVVVAAIYFMLIDPLLKEPGQLVAAVVAGGWTEPAGLRLPLALRVFNILLLLLLGLHALDLGPWFGQLAQRSTRPRVARAWHGLQRGLEPLACRPNVLLLGGGLLIASAGILTFDLAPRLTDTLSPRGVLDLWRDVADQELAAAGPQEREQSSKSGSEGQPQPRELVVYQVPREQTGFYLGRQPRVENRADLLTRLAGATSAYAIVPRERLAELDSALRAKNGKHLHVLDDRSSKLLLVSNRLPPGRSDRNPLVPLLLEQLPRPQRSVGARLDGSLELLGIDLSRTNVAVGGSFTITTYYRVLRPVSRSWKVFLHVETPSYRLETGTTDHPPTQGVFPTNYWRTGDIVKDVFVVKVPFFSPVGTYAIRSGFFIGEERMKVDQPDKHDGKNRILLGEIKVTPL